MELYPRRCAPTQRDQHDDPEDQDPTTRFHRSPRNGCLVRAEQVAGLLHAPDDGRRGPDRFLRRRHKYPTRTSSVIVQCSCRCPRMRIPNADRAIVATEKLTAYLLNVSHKRGAAKARLLLSVGYRSDAPQTLESDLRTQHLSLDVTRTSENAYGVVYEIEGPIRTPSGKTVRFCSIWQIDTGTQVPRFITMYPR